MDQPSPNQYKIMQKLGAGGMGTVYLAMDQQLKRMVAIKVLNTNISHDSSAFKRFVREIEVTAQLDHPNIVKIYHVNTDVESPQLIMEFIQGKTLMDYLEEGNATLQTKLTLLQKVALAVDHAHKKKIIHRDIKPSNIMVRNNGEPVLMDFGIAKVTKVEDKSLTRSGEIIGTLQYMSPEQATGARRDVDHRTDIYSLGAVMYHILTGQMPTTAPTFMEMLDKIVNEEPIPLRELNPEIPAIVESICQKAMAKDKEKRYSTAYALAVDIENYLKGKKTTASHFAQQQRWRKMSKRIGLPLGIGMSLILMVGLLVYVVVPNVLQARHEQELMQSLTDDYRQAQTLLQSQKIEDKQTAYNKILHAWHLSKQDTPTQGHLALQQNILTLLCQTGYDLGVYWWAKDQDKSIFYFASFQNIVAEMNNPAILEKNIAVNSHLTYLRHEIAAFQKCFADLLNQLKSKQNLAAKYPEVVLLQAKIQYQQKNYSEAVSWFALIPQKKNPQESLYYQGLCQYHLKNFLRAEELLLSAYKADDMQSSKFDFQHDLILYLADSVAQQFAYQKIPIVRYQNIVESLEALGQKTDELSPDQLQHYLDMHSRYNIEILAHHPERSSELGQQVLDLANRSLQNDPLYASSYLQRGFAYRYLEKFEAAWEDYDYAFQLDPQQSAAIREMWQIFPYYMDVSDDYVQKFNNMIFRWGVKNQLLTFDVCKEDFIKLRQEYKEANKKIEHVPFNQANFDKFYRNLFHPWKDIRNLAQSALITMVPHQDTLNALEKATLKVGTSESSLATIQEVKQLIQQQQIKEEQIHWCYFVSRIQHYGLIPQQTLSYIQKQETFLKFLRYGILEQPTAPQPDLQKNWILLQFLAARILAQLTLYSPEYDRSFLYDLVQDHTKSLELRIIVAKALRDAGLKYLDHAFLAEYIQRPKSEQHGKFLDIQAVSLLISPLKEEQNLLAQLVKTTPYPVVQMFAFYQLPGAEHDILQDQLEPLCLQALQSNDSNAKMVAILNCSTIERYRRYHKRKILDIHKVFINTLQQEQYLNVQKAVLHNLMYMRNYITKECIQELEKLLNHPELKLNTIATLAGLSHPRVLEMLFEDTDNFEGRIAFFYGLTGGDNVDEYLPHRQRGMLDTMRFLKASHNPEGRGMVYCMSCYFLPCFIYYIGRNEKIFIENQMQLLAYDYLKQKNPTLLFWTLAGIMGVDKISNVNLKLIQEIQQDMTLPLHIRKIATSVLLYTELKQAPTSQQQPIFEQLLMQIRKNPDDPDELWQAALLAYKQALRNNYSDFHSNYSLIGEADSYQTWDHYILRFRRNICDAEIRQRFQKALENIIIVLEIYPQRAPKQEKEWVQAVYWLALLHIQHDGVPIADAILAKDNRYLRDIRLSELWVRIHPSDLPKIIQHWQEVPHLSAYEQAWILRFQAKVVMQKRDYQQSNDLMLKQYILAPNEPLSLIWMAENRLEQQDFVNAHNMVNYMIYLSGNISHSHWTKARIYAAQKDYDGAYQSIRKNLNYGPTIHPIRPIDLDDPIFEGVNRGLLCYHLARRAAIRSAHAEVILWLEQALRYKEPIPPDFQSNEGYVTSFDPYRAKPAFIKIWRQLEKLPKK